MNGGSQSGRGESPVHFRKWRTTIMEACRDIGGRLPPDADWEPFLFLGRLSDSGSQTGVVKILSLNELGDENKKDDVLRIQIPHAAVDADADFLALVGTGWTSNMKVDEMPDRVSDDALAGYSEEDWERIRPRNAPDRYESVFICFAAHGEDGKGWFSQAMARITRRKGRHPLLGEWQEFGNDASRVEGNFIRSLAAGLRGVQMHRRAERQ